VVCGDKRGTFLLGRQRVLCDCAECAARPPGGRELTCTQFEAHAGAGAAKKWKSSMRIRPGGAPEVPAGARPARPPTRAPGGAALAQLDRRRSGAAACLASTAGAWVGLVAAGPAWPAGARDECGGSR